MKPFPCTLFFMALFGGFTLISGCDDITASNQLSESEFSVMHDFLGGMYPGEDDMFIHLMTCTTDHGVLTEPGKLLGYFTSMSPTTACNYIQVNKELLAFPSDIAFGSGVRIFFENEREDIFYAGDWELYYQSYPKSLGIAEISRVGFSDSGDEALLYCVKISGWMAGSGIYVLLRLHDGTWTIEDTYKYWLS